MSSTIYIAQLRLERSYSDVWLYLHCGVIVKSCLPAFVLVQQRFRGAILPSLKLELISRNFNISPRPPPLDNIRVMVIVWRLRGNIIRTALCWIV